MNTAGSRTVSVSTVAYDGYDLRTAFEHLALLGIPSVEVGFIPGYMDEVPEEGFTPAYAAELSRLIESSGLRCSVFSSHMDLGSDDVAPVFLRRMAFAADLGCSIIVSNASSKSTEAPFMSNIETFAGRADELGLTICLENPGAGGDNLINTGADGARLVRRIGSPNVRLNYDPGNFVSHHRGERRPEEDYRDALPVCSHFHVKNVDGDPEGWHHTAIDEGIIDYGILLPDIVSAGISFSLEIPLRVKRSPAGSPRRDEDPVGLGVIDGTLRRSWEYATGFLRK